MTNWQLFLNSLYQPSKLAKAKDIPFWKVIVYGIFLSIIMAVPVSKQVFDFFGDIQTDGKQIAEQIPDFYFQDGTIVTDETNDGFIYQTDTIVFTFDPQGQRSSQAIASDLIGNIISIGFSKNELIVSVANSDLTTSVFGTNELEISYSNEVVANMTSDDVKAMLTETNLPLWGRALVFLVLLYPLWFNLIFTFIITAFACFFYSKMRALPLTYFETLKMTVYCSTLPIILASIISLFSTSFDVSMFTTLATLFIYFQVAKKLAGPS